MLHKRDKPYKQAQAISLTAEKALNPQWRSPRGPLANEGKAVPPALTFTKTKQTEEKEKPTRLPKECLPLTQNTDTNIMK